MAFRPPHVNFDILERIRTDEQKSVVGGDLYLGRVHGLDPVTDCSSASHRHLGRLRDPDDDTVWDYRLEDWLPSESLLRDRGRQFGFRRFRRNKRLRLPQRTWIRPTLGPQDRRFPT